MSEIKYEKFGKLINEIAAQLREIIEKNANFKSENHTIKLQAIAYSLSIVVAEFAMNVTLNKDHAIGFVNGISSVSKEEILKYENFIHGSVEGDLN